MFLNLGRKCLTDCRQFLGVLQDGVLVDEQGLGAPFDRVECDVVHHCLLQVGDLEGKSDIVRVSCQYSDHSSVFVKLPHQTRDSKLQEVRWGIGLSLASIAGGDAFLLEDLLRGQL